MENNFWKKYFDVYDNLNRLIPYRKLLLKIVEELEVKKSEKILDAGSGTGNLSILLDQKGASVTALDYCEEGIDVHKTKPCLETTFMQGDLKSRLPFESESFDKITSNNVLYTMTKKERKKIWKEFYRILKKDGVIVVSNIRLGFKPFLIYKSHLKDSFREKGFLKTFLDVTTLIIPTIKIFYYNSIIKSANKEKIYDFFRNNEQAEEMKEVGFINISPDIYLYSEQAVLNKAKK